MKVESTDNDRIELPEARGHEGMERDTIKCVHVKDHVRIGR